MRSQFAVSLATCALVATTLNAQQVRHSTLGYVLDPATSLVRPMIGVPGAATLGDAFGFGAPVASLAAAPARGFALLLTTSRLPFIYLSETSTLLPLPGVPAGATRVVLSPEGTAAVFFYPDSNQVHVINGLPAAPTRLYDTSLDALFSPLNLLAVSDDGALVMASETSSTAVLNANGLAGRIPLAGSATAIAFFSNSRDALLSSAPETVVIRDAAAQITRTALPAAVNGASGVTVSSDSTMALFSQPASGGVSILSLAPGAQPQTLSCNCAPTGVTRTASPSIYRLNEYSGGPIALIDASVSQPRLLVIPPAAVPDNQ